MKFIVASTLLAALPAWVHAVIITNSNFDNIQVGKPFEITWSEATGPVTLTLKDGPKDNLETVSQLISGATGESYSWTPASSLPSGTYAIEINDGTDVNYSQQFEVTGGSSSSTSASSTGSRTSSTTITSTTSSETTSSTSSTTSSTSQSTSTSGTTSGTTSTSTSTRSSSTSSSSKTSAGTSATAPPNTNAAQTMAPFVAPMLLAVGAVFM